jgi:hypothetical protein
MIHDPPVQNVDCLADTGVMANQRANYRRFNYSKAIAGFTVRIATVLDSKRRKQMNLKE